MKASEATTNRRQDVGLLEENAIVCVGKSVLDDCGLLKPGQTAAATVFTDAGANVTDCGASVYLVTRGTYAIHPAGRERIPIAPFAGLSKGWIFLVGLNIDQTPRLDNTAFQSQLSQPF